MERRERYDPEDIESLLSERSFDELLEEERAFVLRHLSGRDEYEQMRALLHYVRPDEGQRTPIEAEERVRVNVMAAFRAQQRPQWQIWLNSLAAWLKPEAPAGFWRPALAFGSLALLIVAGVVAVRQFNDKSEMATLAEVKQVHSLAKEENAPSTVGSAEEAVKNELEQVNAPQAASRNEETGAVGEVRMERPDAVFNYDMEPAAGASAEVAEAPPIVESPVEDLAAVPLDKDVTTKFTPAATTVSGSTVPALSHVVTVDELARNQSLANGTDVVKSLESKRKRATAKEDVAEKAGMDIMASRSMAQDAALLGLISSGW